MELQSRQNQLGDNFKLITDVRKDTLLEIIVWILGIISCILTHLAYIANGKKTCYIVQQFHWANKRDVTLRHL